MKRTTLCAIFAALPFAATAQSESYTIDPIHSFPHFGIEHLGLTLIWGRFDRMSGKFTLDRAGKKAGVEVAIESASISTGDNEKGNRPRTRDEHLRSADFFNVAEFPRMTYRSTSVKFAGDNPAEIEGQLTLLGVTRPVTLKLERFSCREHPFAKRPACGGSATGSFKRSDFGMKFGIPGIADEVRLMVNFEAIKDQ